MISPSLLLLEDDRAFRASLALEFSERGYTVVEASSRQELDARLAEQGFRFAIVDLRLRGDKGLDAIEAILATSPECRVVVLTGYGSIPTAVEAMRRGAVNYLTKPAPIKQLEKALWLDLLPGGAEPEKPIERESLERHEQAYIEYVMLQCRGNISHAAQWLGIHRQSLQRKLKRTGLK